MLTRRPATAKPTTALVPFRLAAASISSSHQHKASAAGGHVQPTGSARPPSTLPTNFPLASQEPKKGVMQYALYVSYTHPSFLRCSAPTSKTHMPHANARPSRTAQPSTKS